MDRPSQGASRRTSVVRFFPPPLRHRQAHEMDSCHGLIVPELRKTPFSALPASPILEKFDSQAGP